MVVHHPSGVVYHMQEKEVYVMSELSQGGKDCPMCMGTGNWKGTGHCVTCDDSGKIK